MAAKSRMEKYKIEITELINIGITVKSAWKIINNKISDDEKISYNAFLHFINKNIK
ncbi:MAG: hypothetical protein RBR70_12750 [Arcobacter sp.]|jgi:hypothetical protein|uniref:hypothetical protein n=1 Tax=Arcobacter sp. TaxID=1872629 RepID=UPI002A761DDC|nr:hypothetical protein [Arcobacter sp.]MDY3205932.1 hypothetical protein [Arcobacter sp.]